VVVELDSEFCNDCRNCCRISSGEVPLDELLDDELEDEELEDEELADAPP
jgi:hypothetical protein